MSTAVVVLRVVSLLAFAAPVLLTAAVHRAGPRTRARESGGDRAPLVVNVAALGVYFPSLLAWAGSTVGSTVLLLAAVGSLLALAGGALVLGSRTELGPAWSLVPKADQATGLVTTGPYRLVRHPIYFGFALLTTGQALAFASWPALVLVLSAIVPTFAWRARAEEKVLSRTFGERYAVYRQRTRMIIPYLL
jgi:protein-S-isoprenylcysteine O-methyltransferase Ste14